MPQPSFRILFVCHGNICRSTMAEFVLKDMVARRGLADEFEIESAATSTEEIGGFEKKRARQLRRTDYDAFDLIIGMDEANMRNMDRMLGGDPAGKLHKMLEFAGSTRDVADPWYTGDFDTTYEDVCDGCRGLLGHLGF